MLHVTVTIKVIDFLLLFLLNNVLYTILSYSIRYCSNLT